MSWESLGIKDPGLKWDNFGFYQDWNTSKYGPLFEKSFCEIEDLQNDLYSIQEVGLYEKQVNDMLDWADYIEDLLKDASMELDPRNKLINTRFYLIKLKKYFDDFTAQIDWLGVQNEIDDI